MKYELNAKFTSLKWRILFTVFSLLCVIVSSLIPLVGVLIIPAYITVLTLLLVSDSGRFPIFFTLTAIFSIVFEFIMYEFTSLITVASVLTALLIYFSLNSNLITKGETALLSTTILSALFGVMLIFSVFAEIGSNDVNDALTHLETIFEQAKAAFITSFEKAMEEYQSAGIGTATDMSDLMTPELMSEMFDLYANLTISVIVIFAFLLVGSAMKLVGVSLGAMLLDKKSIFKWRFELSSVFAYFYIGMYAVSMFLSSDDVITIAILNLVNVFTFIFAYLGLVSVGRLLSVKFRSAALAYLLLFGAIVMLYGLAINILAVVGVFSMIVLSKSRRMSGDKGDSK